ncbi:glutamate--tRNA ligase [Roseomonas sp. WA12]
MKVRFAPSPTGWLHVGNARPALANWLEARKRGGSFTLRLDDTDAERSKPEYAQGIEEDLRWLGLDWDAFFRQSDRLERYAAAAEVLKKKGVLYPCLESEEELNFKRDQRRKQGRAPIYDRAALRMTPDQLERALANGKTPYYRFKLNTRTVSWQDGVLGERNVKLPSLSDPVLIRADGSFLYTFTSVVDDLETGITHIIRGEDHVTNTGIQIDIIEALSGRPNRIYFAHMPLLTDAEGGALSKRLGSISLRQFRRDGIEPEAITGYLAALGSSRDPAPAAPRDLVRDWDITRISHSSARFDTKQLLALNRKHLHALDYAAVKDRLPEGADEAFWLAIRGNLDLLAEVRDWYEVARGEITVPEQPEEIELLRAALASIPPGPWDETTWPAWTATLSAATGRKGKALFLPLRRALTGEEHGPDLKVFLPLIGPDRARTRLSRSTA